MNNVFSFLGGDHKCGTSMIAQSVAEAIAIKNPTSRILLIHTEKDESGIFSPNVNESLETIRPYLAERLIDMAEIADKSRYKENLYIIGGSFSPGSSNAFIPEMSEYLLCAASSIFDIIICDTGCDIENGMCIGALFSSNEIYLVCTPSEAALRRQEGKMSLYKKINLPFRGIVLNKYSRSCINSSKIVCERLGFKEESLFIVSQSANGEKAEQEQKSIYSMRDIKFKREIDKIADDLTKRAQSGQLQF